ncbi:MAG: hypothetical protein CMH31_02460 [Micavibrio sp.]|nr:hypothetical protein [Micavibrio sp.]
MIVFYEARMTFIEILPICFFILAGLYKSPKTSIIFYTLSSVVFLYIYVDLGLFMAAISIGLSIVRGIGCITLNHKYNNALTFITTALIILLIAVEISHMADTLIIIAAVFIGTACYYRDCVILFRATTALSQILWIIHSVIFDVPSMLICSCIVLSTCIWALIKHTDQSDIEDALSRLTFKKA